IRISIRASRREVRRLDDERVAVPVAARVAHIQADALARMRAAVQPDHPRFMNHLVADGDEALPLHDLVRVAIHAGQHRSWEPPRDTALPGTEILGAVEWSVAKAAAANSRRARPRFRCHRRNPAL